MGVRIGGIGLGVMGGLGLGILCFVFHLNPTSPPVDVMLMILSVITAGSALQAAGGLTLLVRKAEAILRNHPERITYLGPLVTFLFTLLSGTGHIAYSILPVIAEVSRETGIRPERPLSVSVIASQQAITASPVSAATVALLALTSQHPDAPGLIHILGVCIPSTLIGIIISAFIANRCGKELSEEPAFAASRGKDLEPSHRSRPGDQITSPGAALLSVILFLGTIAAIITFGAFPGLRSFSHEGKLIHLEMATIIEIVSLSAAALIIWLCKVKTASIPSSGIFQAGVQAVIAIFGVAWLGDTFFAGNAEVLEGAVREVVRNAPWTFAFALFFLSVILFSQAATVRALMPFGLSLGIPPSMLVAIFPAVNGYFLIPNYPTLVAAIQFDRTGTTKVGTYLFNHSFMLPGLIATAAASVHGRRLRIPKAA